jgi:hypothetical protein
MKKMVLLSLSLLIGLVLTNCKKDVTPSYNLNITLALPTGYTAAALPNGVEIKIVNTQTGRETVAIANASGSVTQLLVEGNYSLKCNFTVTADGLEYVFNGSLTNYMLTKEATAKIDLVLAKNTGGFIFKEIYFSGSKTPDARTYYSDQFHEIYNNSNDTLYADKLCIGVLQQTGTSPNIWVNADGSFMDDLPLTFHVWTVPGTGKEHPVYPGKSIIIAQDGINHKTDPNGNPNSPVDLSKADWETYVDAAGKDIDAPAVPNLTMMATTSTSMFDWIHSVNGSAVILFRLPVDWQTYVANTANFKTAPGSTSTTKYFMVNKSLVIDAVEILQADPTKQYKRLHNILDAGFTQMDAGSYSSLSVRRKAKMIVSGRVIYKDTNNSTVDFLHDLNPTPGVNPTAVEN